VNQRSGIGRVNDGSVSSSLNNRRSNMSSLNNRSYGNRDRSDDGSRVADLDFADVGSVNGNIDGDFLDMEFRVDFSDLRCDGGNSAGGSQDTLLGHGVQGGSDGTEVGFQYLKS